MLPHPIRLRQPWEEVPAAAPNCKAYRRAFNRPTGLDSWESVLLEIDRILYCGQVTLNGQEIGTLEPNDFFSVEITSMLQPANELLVQIDPATALNASPQSHSVYIVEPNEPLGSPIGDVRLLIRVNR